MPPSLTSEQQSWRRRVFAVTWLTYAGFYLCRKNLSVAMPLLAGDLGYSNMELANLVFGFSLLYALAQFGFGPLCDRYGPRVVVGLGVLVSIFSNVLMGAASSLVLLVVLSCLNGAGQASGWPGLVKNMAPWFVRRERGVVMAWWATNYVLGGFLATLFATFVATHPALLVHLGWRRGFWAPALLLSLIALGFVSLTRNRPSDAGLPEIAGEDAEAAGPAHRFSLRYLRVITDPAVAVIAAGCFFSKITRYAFLFWLPLYMTQSLGYGADEAGYTSSLFEFVGFAGALIAGYVSDRLMQSRRAPVAALMLWGLAVACWLHPTLAAQGRLGVAAGISLIGIMNYGPDTILQGAASQDVGSKWGVGVVAGFISGVGSFGQLFSPYLVAYVAENYGWDNLFYLFVVFALAGGGLLATRWNNK